LLDWTVDTYWHRHISQLSQGVCGCWFQLPWLLWLL